jgi:mRNA interferase RelE/StbE
VPDTVRNLIRTLRPEIKARVRRALDDIAEDPACGKPLGGELAGLRTLRVGSYRVIYRRDNNQTAIIAIGPRESIYEETARLILRGRRNSSES